MNAWNKLYAYLIECIIIVFVICEMVISWI